ncbi:MAG: N5-glutamine methyltransferase family protein, partial [Acidimicrobiales bacterium]
MRALGAPEEARWLVEAAASEAWPSCLNEIASGRGADYFNGMLIRRRQGEPLQYVLGRWGFRSLELMVDQRVLIPRPETETVVEVALEHLDLLGELGRSSPVVVDLGTGSGAIALSVAAERPGAEVWATGESSEDLEVARVNLAGPAGRAAAA